MKLLGESVFHSVQKAKTEEEIFNLIRQHRESLENKDNNKMQIMKGDSGKFESPSQNTLNHTVTQRFNEHKNKFMTYATKGTKDLITRV